MKPKEALNVLLQAAQNARLTAAEHQVVAQSYEDVLKALKEEK